MLRGLVVLLSGFFLLLFLYTALRRMRYPFELEWIESGILMSVRHIAQGHGLYVAPSLDFVPFLYAPLYLYLAAAVAKFTGLSYATLRLVSTVAMLGSCALISGFIFTETRRGLAAIAGAGLFLACYPLVEGFYDIGRVDSLFVFFLLLALLLLRRGHPILSALAWVLCFQTKQSVLPVAIVLLCADWQHPRRILAGLATFIAVLGASMASINYATHGWYVFYLFHIAGGFGIVWREALLFFPNDIVAPLGMSLLLCFAAWAFTGIDLRGSAASFYATVTVVLLGAIGYVAAHAGAAVNAYIPVYAWISILFGVAFDRLLSRFERRSGRAALATTVVLAAVVAQLAMFIYNPGRYLPPPAVREARQRFIDQVRALPGDVYVFSHTYDAVLAGKQPHAENGAIGAVMFAPANPASTALRKEFDEAVQSHRYSAIVVDGAISSNHDHFTDYGFLKAYPYALSAESEEDRFLTSQPRWILLPCATAQSIVSSAGREDSSLRAGECSATKP
jgi:4-amino-4-deoxy-L-arabinose transferase-like glycosyltransferase